MPTLLTSLLFLWLAVLAVVIYNWYKFRRQQIWLQRFLYLIPIVKLIGLASGLFYWKTMSRHGEVSFWQQVSYYTSSVVFETLLFAVLLLISKGWYITRTQLSRTEKQSIFVTLGALVMVVAFYRLYGGFYLFSLATVYLLLVKYIFNNIAYNQDALQSQLGVVQQYFTRWSRLRNRQVQNGDNNNSNENTNNRMSRRNNRLYALRAQNPIAELLTIPSGLLSRTENATSTGENTSDHSNNSNENESREIASSHVRDTTT